MAALYSLKMCFPRRSFLFDGRKQDEGVEIGWLVEEMMAAAESKKRMIYKYIKEQETGHNGSTDESMWWWCI